MASEPKNPCKDCENRAQGCHSVCMVYFAWKLEHDAWAKNCRIERNGDHEVVHFRITGRDKNRKRRRK